MPNDYTGLLSGEYWSGIEVTGKPTIVTYSFPTVAPAYDATITDPNLTPAALASFTAFTAAEQAMARQALAEWGNNSGLIFIEVSPGQGDINFQKLDFTGTGYAGYGGIAYHPFGGWQFASYPSFTSDLDSSGDVFMNSATPIVYGTLLHEIGHALGLKHPTEVWTDFASSPPTVHNVWTVDDPNLTIMSQLSGGTGHLTAIDIQAIQSIYGTQAQDGTQVQSWSWNASKQTLTQTGYATDDVIRGSSVIDVISGGNGNDKLFGLNGNDTLYGGAGDDLLDGGPGSDKLVGGTGDDTYFVTTTGDKITENLNEGYDTVVAVTSYTLAANVEQLQIWGNAKVTGTGNALDNRIFGNNASNTLNGAAGKDYIVGGTAADKIAGGAGSDLVYGGNGKDTFVFNALSDFGPTGQPDTIGDFVHLQDKIDLKKVDPDAVLTGDQSFTFVGTAAFTADSHYQLRYSLAGGNAVVEGDINHDTVADFSILLYGVTILTASDFVL
jgi:hypothetical protein